jgi:RimJ/RimL family protein N-acetyltransferase
MIIKLLTEDDAPIFRSLRIQALRDDPIVFISYYEFEINKPMFYFKNLIASSKIYGVFIDNKLVAMTTVARNSFKKQNHKAVSTFTYTTPSSRGQGLARAVKIVALDGAQKDGIKQISTGIISTNIAMIELNKSLGFNETYTEKNAMQHYGIFYDLTYLIKYFDDV